MVENDEEEPSRESEYTLTASTPSAVPEGIQRDRVRVDSQQVVEGVDTHRGRHGHSVSNTQSVLRSRGLVGSVSERLSGRSVTDCRPTWGHLVPWPSEEMVSPG